MRTERGAQTVREVVPALAVSRGHGGNDVGMSGEAAIKIPSDARGQIVNRLRSAEHAGRLLGKPDQGKVFEVSSQSRVSNHFIRGSSFTRFADWRFIHKARLDILLLNSA